jgi:hypothetical protein
MNLENELREALRREPAPVGFADRVLARASRSRRNWFQRPAVLALAAGLAFAAAIPPVVHQYYRQRRALEAKDQLMTALAITRVQLQLTKEKIRQNTRHKL